MAPPVANPFGLVTGNRIRGTPLAPAAWLQGLMPSPPAHEGPVRGLVPGSYPPEMTQTMAALFLCAAPLLAQTTWTVDVEGGGDFTTLQAAVDAASDGDTILVNYWSGLPVTWNFTLTKGLTIVGVGYQRAETRGHLVIANLPANRRVVLRSLQLSRLSSHPTSVTVQGCVGAVVFDDVVLDGAFGQMFGGPALTVASSHRVHVGRTQLTGAPGLAVDDATVTCTSSWIGGTTVVSGPGTTAPAVDAGTWTP